MRATFRLHPLAVERISILAAQWGIRQKSLFDYLMEETGLNHVLGGVTDIGEFDQIRPDLIPGY